MPDREKVIKGLECCACMNGSACRECPYSSECIAGEATYQTGTAHLAADALELLKEQEPRVLTLEEVVDHYSLPPIFVDDFNAQENYLKDIKPLYFDFLDNDNPWAVHWRDYDSASEYIYKRKSSYGKKWMCWTEKPTEEQRKAVK